MSGWLAGVVVWAGTSASEPDVPARPSAPSSIPLATLPNPTATSGRVRIERVCPEIRMEEPLPFASHRLPSYSVSEIDSDQFVRWSDQELTDSRFASELSSRFALGIGSLRGGRFRAVAETLPTLTVLSDPFAEERNQSAWSRGGKHFRSLVRKSAKESTVGGLVVHEMRAWRDRPLSFLVAMAGNSLEQETPEGGRLILGPDWNDLRDSVGTSNLFRVRYLTGPFETRAGPRKAWIRYKADWLGYSLYLKSSYDYLDGDTSYQLGIQRELAPSTRLEILGGAGVGSETLTGFSTFPLEPQEGRRFGVIGYLERRF